MGIPNLEETVEQNLPLGKRTPAQRAGMTEVEWREAIRFDGTDWGWVIMSIGMAIGAGIVFLPVQVGGSCQDSCRKSCG